ncbi:MAG: ATP-binding protein [Pseudomonadota bacterium]
MDPSHQPGEPQQTTQQVDSEESQELAALRALIERAPGPVVLIDLERSGLVDINDAATQLFGYSREYLRSASLMDLSPPLQPDGRSSWELAQENRRRVRAGDSRAFEWTYLHADGRPIPCEVRFVLLPSASGTLIHGSITDITAQKLAESLRTGQSHLLELIAKGVSLQQVLDSLMLLIESQSEGLYCSVLLLDEDGIHIHPGSGPHMPASYMAALEGFPIGPVVGSCGTAMYRKEAVVVTDLMTDPLWAPYEALVEPHGFRACWSTPIILNREVVLGSFAMYYKEVRSPGPVELGLMGVATHIAGIAIERTRRERELERHRFHLEDLVAERTAELSAAKARTEASNLALSVANQDLASALATLSATQEELVRRDKLAALGALVAGVAHELNTPIGNCLVAATTLSDRAHAFSGVFATGLTRSMVEKFIADATLAGDLLVRSLQRAANLVTSFKQVAVEQTSAQRCQFALADSLQGIETLCGKPAFIIHCSVEGDIAIDSYPGPLTDVLLNLVNNAVVHGYAGRSAGDIYVSVKPALLGWIELSVEDLGEGITPANLKRIFDPFFTTKLGTGSSGLGLYITHNIVSGILGGRIHVNSEVGRGSTFTLILPTVAPMFQRGLEAVTDKPVQ